MSQVQRKYNKVKGRYEHVNFWKYKEFTVISTWVLEKYWQGGDEAGMERINQGVLIVKDTEWYGMLKSFDSLEYSRE